MERLIYDFQLGRKHCIVAIKDILGDKYDLDRLRELTQADKEGRCVVLPEEPINARYDVADILQDDLNEADYSDPSVGIYGLTWAERELWQAIIDGLNSGRGEVEKALEEKKNG